MPSDAKGLDEVSIKLCAGPWSIPSGSDGVIDFKLAPVYEQFQVEVHATGFDDGRKTRNAQIEGKSILFGKIDLGEVVNEPVDRMKTTSAVQPLGPELSKSRPNLRYGSY